MATSRTRPSGRGAGMAWLDPAMLAVGVWLLAGGYLDAWAHRNTPDLESFFTPWHGVLYSGLLAAAVVLGAARARDQLADAYRWSGVGIVVFFIAGAADSVWHTLFGVEESFEALLSPPHLVLMASAVAIVSGSLRSGLEASVERASWLAVAGAAFVLTEFTFFSQFDQPLVDWTGVGHEPPWDAWLRELHQEHGVLGIIIHSAVLAGILAFLLRRTRLPRGALAGIVGTNTLAMWMLERQPRVLIVGAIGVTVGEVALHALRPGPHRPDATRAFVAVVPAGLFAGYFAVGAAWEGIWWPTHLWTGAIAIAAVTGWLVAHLAAGTLRSWTSAN